MEILAHPPCRKIRVGEARYALLFCPVNGKNMYHHGNMSDREVASLIRTHTITLGGYKKAKIYGRLHCSPGKRMKRENRVFFRDEKEALQLGYRPCGVCMPEKYRQWKRAQVPG